MNFVDELELGGCVAGRTVALELLPGALRLAGREAVVVDALVAGALVRGPLDDVASMY